MNLFFFFNAIFKNVLYELSNDIKIKEKDKIEAHTERYPP
jgi:hypothetical protein